MPLNCLGEERSWEFVVSCCLFGMESSLYLWGLVSSMTKSATILGHGIREYVNWPLG